MTLENARPEKDDITESCSRLFSGDGSPYRVLRDNYTENNERLQRLDDETPRLGFEALDNISRVYSWAGENDIERACEELNNVQLQIQIAACTSAMVLGRYHEAQLKRKELPFAVYQVLLQNKMSRSTYVKSKRDMETFRREALNYQGTDMWKRGETSAKMYSTTAETLNRSIPSRYKVVSIATGAAIGLATSVLTLAGSLPLPF